MTDTLYSTMVNITRHNFFKNRSCLVPAISFGENDYFYTIYNPEGSLLLYIQNRIKDSIGLVFSIAVGRGLFKKFGKIPLRRPINVVSKL